MKLLILGLIIYTIAIVAVANLVAKPLEVAVKLVPISQPAVGVE